MEDAFLQYYEMLLGQEESLNAKVSPTVINEGKVRTSDQQIVMCRSFTAEEVKRAVFDIDETKAPGPNGYTSVFKKKSWQCIGEDITEAILDFFHSGKLLKQVNATTLCLMPKVEQPVDVTNSDQ